MHSFHLLVLRVQILAKRGEISRVVCWLSLFHAAVQSTHIRVQPSRHLSHINLDWCQSYCILSTLLQGDLETLNPNPGGSLRDVVYLG